MDYLLGYLSEDVPAGFLRSTFTFPVVVGGEVTSESAVCVRDNKYNLQPVEQPEVKMHGQITGQQAENIQQSLADLGAMGEVAP